jgi:hypothetical protein
LGRKDFSIKGSKTISSGMGGFSRMVGLARKTKQATQTLVQKRESAVRAKLQATLQKIDKDKNNPDPGKPLGREQLKNKYTPHHSTPLHSTPLHTTPLHTPLHSTLYSTLHTPHHSTPFHAHTQMQSSLMALRTMIAAATTSVLAAVLLPPLVLPLVILPLVLPVPVVVVEVGKRRNPVCDGRKGVAGRGAACGMAVGLLLLLLLLLTHTRTQTQAPEVAVAVAVTEVAVVAVVVANGR